MNDTWPEQRFGFFVGRTADWVSHERLDIESVPRAGSITLGGVDPSLFEGELKGTESNLTKWWTVGIDGVRVNGQDIDIKVGLENRAYGNVGGKASAMLDTGLSELAGPEKAVERVYKAVPGAFRAPEHDIFFLPRTHAEPKLEFCFAGGCWDDALLDPQDCRSRDEMMEFFASQVVQAEREGVSAETWCSGNLLADGDAGDEFPQWSLGDAFLQNWYIAHQLHPPEVQIAPLSRKAREMVKEANIGINRVLEGKAE